jgi:hypothetical protein
MLVAFSKKKKKIMKHARIAKKTMWLHRTGLEPVPEADRADTWEASILPLNYRCEEHRPI